MQQNDNIFSDKEFNVWGCYRFARCMLDICFYGGQMYSRESKRKRHRQARLYFATSKLLGLFCSVRGWDEERVKKAIIKFNTKNI